MGLGVTLQVWETDTDGDGVVSEMPHVGHKTFFFFFLVFILSDSSNAYFLNIQQQRCLP